MANARYRLVRLYKKLAGEGEGWGSTPTTIENARNVTVRLSTGRRNDTFSFNVNNPFGFYSSEKFVGDGSTTEFTLSNVVTPELASEVPPRIKLLIDDVQKQYDTHYTIGGVGKTLTISTAPSDGAVIEFRNPIFETGDRVKINLWKNSTWANLTTAQKDTSLVTDGIVTKVQPRFETTRTIKVTGANLTDTLLSSAAFSSTNTATTADVIIQDVIDQVNDYNPGKSIAWASGNATGTKSILPRFGYRPAIDIIDELSKDQWTGSGPHYYYVTYNTTTDRFEFVWKQKSPTDAKIPLVEGDATDDVRNWSRKNDLQQVVSGIIYYVGLDCYNVPRRFFHQDLSIEGSKTRVIFTTATHNIINNLIQREYEADTTVWSTDTREDGAVARIERFPDNYAAYTMQFETRDSDGNYSGSDYTISDDGDFNNAITTEAEWLGKEIAQSMIDRRAKPFDNISALIGQDSSTYSLGNLLSITSQALGRYSKPLRLEGLTHDVFRTQLGAVEDETSVGHEEGGDI